MSVYVEVGMGALRRRGYGHEFPFEEADLYVSFDLRHTVGALAFTPQLQPITQPILLGPEPFDKTIHKAAYTNVRDLQSYVAARNIIFAPVYGDGRMLPLLDNSVDGLLFSEVIGDPLLSHVDKTALIDEALRVVKPGRFVVARETLSPFTAGLYLEARQAEGVEWELDTIGPGSGRWQEMQGHYDLRDCGTIYRLSLLSPVVSLPLSVTRPGADVSQTDILRYNTDI